jgi:hypothetical protein
VDDATERRFRREGCRLAEEMALQLDMYVLWWWWWWWWWFVWWGVGVLEHVRVWVVMLVFCVFTVGRVYWHLYRLLCMSG